MPTKSTRAPAKSAPKRKIPVKRPATSTAREKPAAAKRAAPAQRKSTPAKPRSVKSTAGAKTSKQSQLIDLLRSAKGGTIEQMAALTGWQAHTVRGTISGVLRKRLGLNVQSATGADSGARVYRIQPAA